MPTYTYACKDCGERLEVVRSFSDDPLTVCPSCDGALRQVFKPAGIVFKGSGWHIKDYASTSGGGAAASGDGSSNGSSTTDTSSSGSSEGSSNGSSAASTKDSSSAAATTSSSSSTSDD